MKPAILVNEHFSSTQCCSLKNSASGWSNLFFRSTCFPVAQEVTRGGGHRQKTKLLIISNLQGRDLSEHVLLDLVLGREIGKTKTNNFRLSTNAVDCCRKVLEARQGCCSKNSWVDPNYPSDVFEKIKSSIEASKPVVP